MTPSRRFPSRRLSRQNAFTLLEILIVLAIVGLLAGLTISKFTGIFDTKTVDVAKMFVQTSMKTPLVAYRLDMGDYPSTAEGLQALVTAPASRGERWRGPYIEVNGGKLPDDPWGRPYQYRYPGTHNKTGYDVFSYGPDGVENENDIGNW